MYFVLPLLGSSLITCTISDFFGLLVRKFLFLFAPTSSFYTHPLLYFRYRHPTKYTINSLATAIPKALSFVPPHPCGFEDDSFFSLSNRLPHSKQKTYRISPPPYLSKTAQFLLCFSHLPISPINLLAPPEINVQDISESDTSEALEFSSALYMAAMMLSTVGEGGYGPVPVSPFARVVTSIAVLVFLPLAAIRVSI